MKRAKTGTFIDPPTGDEVVRAFIPAPLPPELAIEPALPAQLDKAIYALGRLPASLSQLPDTKLLL